MIITDKVHLDDLAEYLQRHGLVVVKAAWWRLAGLVLTAVKKPEEENG